MNDFDFGDFTRSPELENRYWVDDSPLLRAFGSILPPKLADLVDLAMAVYYADRRSQRNRTSKSFELTGHREIHIRLRVRELELWKSKEISSSLVNLLSWFTEDTWEFEFSKSNVKRKSEYVEPLFASPVSDPKISLLFSGGLDSLAGLCSLMGEHQDCSFIVISGSTSQRTTQIQRDLIKELVRYWHRQSRELRSLVVPFGIRRPERTCCEETSQRSRGFVFLLIGATAAIMAKSTVLYVCENGVGAANLPFNEGQLGIDNTRGVHPLSLARSSDFLGLFPGRSMQIVNPHAAGLDGDDPANLYRFDVKKSFAGLRRDQLYPLMAMLDQADRIRTCLGSKSPWEALTEAFPELFEIQHDLCDRRQMAMNDVAQSYLRMYRAYVEEWKAFPLNLSLR